MKTEPVGYQREFLNTYLPKQTLREVITHPQLAPLSCIQHAVAAHVPESEQAGVQALLIEELRRLHEGVLARYGLRLSDYATWKAVHGR